MVTGEGLSDFHQQLMSLMPPPSVQQPIEDNLKREESVLLDGWQSTASYYRGRATPNLDQ